MPCLFSFSLFSSHLLLDRMLLLLLLLILLLFLHLILLLLLLSHSASGRRSGGNGTPVGQVRNTGNGKGCCCSLAAPVSRISSIHFYAIFSSKCKIITRFPCMGSLFGRQTQGPKSDHFTQQNVRIIYPTHLWVHTTRLKIIGKSCYDSQNLAQSLDCNRKLDQGKLWQTLTLTKNWGRLRDFFVPKGCMIFLSW